MITRIRLTMTFLCALDLAWTAAPRSARSITVEEPVGEAS